jgi:hypothetical protein
MSTTHMHVCIPPCCVMHTRRAIYQQLTCMCVFLLVVLCALGEPYISNSHMRTRGTVYQQLNINAERQQFPHPQLLTPDDDQFGRNM